VANGSLSSTLACRIPAFLSDKIVFAACQPICRMDHLPEQNSVRIWRDTAAAMLLFVGAFGAYLANGDFLPINDAKTAVYLPISLLREGKLSFTPHEMPFMFHWRLQTRRGPLLRTLSRWDQRFGGYDAETLYRASVLTVERQRAFLVPTIQKDVYVSTWGPASGLCAVPLAWVADLWVGDLDAPVLWHVGKWTASLSVALSVVFVFLASRAFARRAAAVGIASAYALGTCVFSISSQALWQHGPNEMFLALGVLGLVRIERYLGYAALSGAALGAATWCRPTSALVVVAVGVHLLLTHRRALVAFILGGLPLAAALLAYNLHYFGQPLAFGQMMLEHVAREKTGAASMWQTPLAEGAAGLLLSPSRGLFVYSPFLLLAPAGAWVAWRHAKFAALRPLSVAVLAIWLVEFKHFDWWGGWSFGYRHIVDTTTLLALFLLPTLGWVGARWWRTAAFLTLLAWSVAVQVVGVAAFNLSGWNARLRYDIRFVSPQRVVSTFDETEMAALDAQPGTRVKRVYLDVDLPRYRSRLWSVTDSQLVYYVQHFRQARRQKRQFMKRWLEEPAL